MILAETLMCRVPSENAVKLEKLYCTITPPSYPAGLGDVATWVGVLLTATMAYFAYRAWKTSRAQLLETRSIALNEQRVPALLDLLEGFQKHLKVPKEVTRSLEASRNYEIMRLVDRWTLTYPGLHASKNLRSVASEATDFTSLVSELKDIISEIHEFDQLHDVFLLLVSTRDEATAFLWSLGNELDQTCREIHNEDLTTREGDEIFSKLNSSLYSWNQKLISTVTKYEIKEIR